MVANNDNEIILVSAEEWMVESVAYKLRDVDVKSSLMRGMNDPADELKGDYIAGDIRYAVMWKDNPIALIGVSSRQGGMSLLNPTSYIWMVGTDDIGKVGVAGVRRAIVLIEEIATDCGDLCAYIFDDYTVAQKFAKSLGFLPTSFKMELKDKQLTYWSRKFNLWHG
jgi:hypothetical protein